MLNHTHPDVGIPPGVTGSETWYYVGSALYGRLPRLIRRFRQRCPAVRLELREATSAQQVAMLRDGQCDVALVIPPVADAGDLILADFDEDRLALALPRGHPLAGLSDVPLQRVADEPFVLWPATEGRGFHVRVIRLCAEAGFVPRIVQEAHQMHGVLSLVAVEAGISIVPESMSSFRADEVVYRAIPGAAAKFSHSLCWRDQPLGPAVSRFLTMAGNADDTLGLS